MKLKRLIAWLLILVLCFSLTACQDSAPSRSRKRTTTTEENTTTTTTATTHTHTHSDHVEQTPPPSESAQITPLLYRVTDGDGNVVWLFGSIHIGREDYYPLPDYVQDAFDGADSLAVEADIIAFEKDLNRQMQALSGLVYLDGTSIEDHIPAELYEDAVNVLEKLDTYMSVLDMYYPVLWSSMIESLLYEELGGDANLGIDRHLIQQAYDSEKEILEVESAEFQYEMLAGFSEELQILMLESSVELYQDQEAAKESMTAMMDLWAAGDEQAFAAYLADDGGDMTATQQELYEEYNQALIVERNLSMADYAEEALRSGKEVFICVGAAHIVGDGALAQLLAQRGYTVECILS